MSLSIGHRLTEAITVKRTSSHTTGGDPTRTVTLTMSARIERANGDVANSLGRDASSDDLVLTEVELLVGDMLFFAEDDPLDSDTGRLVMNVEQRRALDGRVTHYAATC